jgi:hypothetical protein
MYRVWRKRGTALCFGTGYTCQSGVATLTPKPAYLAMPKIRTLYGISLLAAAVAIRIALHAADAFSLLQRSEALRALVIPATCNEDVDSEGRTR